MTFEKTLYIKFGHRIGVMVTVNERCTRGRGFNLCLRGTFCIGYIDVRCGLGFVVLCVNTAFRLIVGTWL